MPPGGIRTHDLSRQAAAGLRLRPRGHWDRHMYIYTHTHIYIYTLSFMYRASFQHKNTRPEQYRYCKNQWLWEQLYEVSWRWACGPKRVQIRQYRNKIETVTSVSFSFLIYIYVYTYIHIYICICFIAHFPHKHSTSRTFITNNIIRSAWENNKRSGTGSRCTHVARCLSYFAS